LLLEESHTHRTIGFVRYHSVLERRGDAPEVTTATLPDGAPAKLEITSAYIPATGREYVFAPSERTVPQPAAGTNYSGK
jgi:hypothetical protein